MKPIAYIHTDLPEKFGIPRQSGLVKELKGKIIFEPEYRSMDAVKGLEGFNYIWLFREWTGHILMQPYVRRGSVEIPEWEFLQRDHPSGPIP